MGTKRQRVNGFGPLADRLRQASGWRLSGRYVSERRGVDGEDDQQVSRMSRGDQASAALSSPSAT